MYVLYLDQELGRAFTLFSKVGPGLVVVLAVPAALPVALLKQFCKTARTAEVARTIENS